MDMDHSPTYPLEGGMTITMDANPDVEGTLGYFLRDRNDSTAVYALTNYHVAAKNMKLSLSWRAEGNLQLAYLTRAFATAEGGGVDKYRDAALLRLDAGVKWLPSIKDLGFIPRAHYITVDEAAPLNYQVRKRGARTKVTGGIVEALNFTWPLQPGASSWPNGLLIRPNPDSNFADQQVVFDFFGDSGSVVVNDKNEIVALLWGGENNYATLLHGYAVSIAVVLDRFKAVEGLDLYVPSVDTSKPETIADQTLTVPPPAGAKLKTVAQMIAGGDAHYYRPLVGGSQILAAPMLGAPNAATLGCIVTDTAHPGSAWALTSFRNLTANGTIPPTGETKIGQPDNHSSISGCCSNTFAHFAFEGASPGASMAALVKLEDDQRWLPEVLRIGLVHIAQSGTVFANSLVRKHGAETRLTGGKVVALGGHYGTLPAGVSSDAMLVAPNPDPAQPDVEMCFSQPGDRGALIVNEYGGIFGMLYDEVDIPDANGRRVIHGVGAPIQSVLDGLNQAAGLDLAIATATVINIPLTTHARIAAAIGDLPAQPERDWLGDARDELAALGAGQRLAAKWRAHHDEIRDLIRHNRRVAAVWHRSGGPALVQAIASTLRSDAARLPSLVNGMPLRTVIERIAAVLLRYGSAQLRIDLALLQSHLPSMEGLGAHDLLSALAAAVTP
jgi:hypothetical protein